MGHRVVLAARARGVNLRAIGDLVLAVFNVGGEYYTTDDLCTHGPGRLFRAMLSFTFST